MLPLNAITLGPLPPPSEGGSLALPIGTFEGRVANAAGALIVRVGAVQLPLPENAPFVPGQLVSVTRSSQGAAIEVRPVAIPASPPRNMSQVLARVLTQIEGAAHRNPDGLVSLLPASAPLTQGHVHQLLTLFAIRGALGPHLAAMAGHLQTALASGWTAPEWARSFVQLARAQPDSEPDAVVSWLKQIYRSGVKTPEGALANSTPAEASEGLLAQIRMLQRDAGLRAVLETAGRWSSFAAHVDGAAERLEARALHQLHALDANYVFAELPAPFLPDFSSIQVHWFGEDAKGTSTRAGADQLVLDISVSQLGDLWIILQAGRDYCRCVVRASAEKSVQALSAGASALESALQETGYPQVTVVVESWDGDRLRAAANLMRRSTGLDVNA